MTWETLGTTCFVGIFNNRRAWFGASKDYNVEVKSEEIF